MGAASLDGHWYPGGQIRQVVELAALYSPSAHSMIVVAFGHLRARCGCGASDALVSLALSRKHEKRSLSLRSPESAWAGRARRRLSPAGLPYFARHGRPGWIGNSLARGAGDARACAPQRVGSAVADSAALACLGSGKCSGGARCARRRPSRRKGPTRAGRRQCRRRRTGVARGALRAANGSSHIGVGSSGARSARALAASTKGSGPARGARARGVERNEACLAELA